ncbi:MAG: MFS transporter [Gemmatimonadaceae bacterium]
MTAAPSPPVSHQRVTVVFSGLMLAMLLAALDSTIVATALPTIVGELGGLAHLSWVVTAYLLAQTVVTPLYGKLGDLYGRKGVLQSAIVLFLAGSVLCGMSQSMTQLIVFRAIQGLGGGGLTVTTQAVVGDIVPPRERGRYQGIFGAVFGLSSIAGPLVGGYFTTHLSWRWIFYVNVPLGLLAMAVLAVTLPSTGSRKRHAIDYAGAGLLATALASIILVADLGGATYPWESPTIFGLGVAAAISLVAFIWTERRATEPVLPLSLFRNRAFATTSGLGFIVGFALFGSVTYLPLFLQVVLGSSPTASGLQMLPLMGGMLVTSIVSGQLISRTGRYKRYPIAGTAVMTLGLYLLSRLTAGSALPEALVAMLVLGLGLGLVMQVLVIAVQNAVDYRDLGVATSGAMLFRLIGGSFGTAVLGAIFAARLTVHLRETLPPEVQAAGGLAAAVSPASLALLPDTLRTIYSQAFSASLSTVYAVATLVAVVGFAVAWMVPEHPLRETVAAAAGGDVGGELADAFAMPTDRDSASQLRRGLGVLAARDVQRQHIAGIVARAGLELSPAAAWLLVRLGRDPSLDLLELARVHEVEPPRLRAGLEELRAAGLLVERGATEESVVRELTAEGESVLDRLAAARRERLAELFSEWPPERHEEISASLRQLARELVPRGATTEQR